MYYEVIEYHDLELRENPEFLEFFETKEEDGKIHCWLKNIDDISKKFDKIIEEIRTKIQPIIKKGGSFICMNELGERGYKIIIGRKKLEIWEGIYDFVPKKKIL